MKLPTRFTNAIFFVVLVIFLLAVLWTMRSQRMVSRIKEGINTATVPLPLLPELPAGQTSNTLSGTGTGVGTQYVKISDGGEYLHISQLAVFDALGNNVATAATPSAGSDYNGLSKLVPIDGDLKSGARLFPLVFHSNGPPWYQLKLAQVTNVAYVVIYNRGDCCQNRLTKGFKLYLMDANNKTIFTSQTLLGDSRQIIQVPQVFPPVIDYNQNVTGGEGQNADLQCPPGQILTDGLVSYGKWDGNGNGVKVSKDNAVLFGTDFRNKNDYGENINNGSFQQDPLYGIYKQFDVKYRCVPDLPNVDGCKFDVAAYKSFYSMQNSTDDVARMDYVMNGIQTFKTPCGNKDPNCVFDPYQYADLYPDLKKAYGYDEAKLTNHYQTYGIKEGRTICPPPVKQPLGMDAYGLQKWEFPPSMGKWYNSVSNGFSTHLHNIGFTQYRNTSFTFLFKLNNTNSEWRNVFRISNTGGNDKNFANHVPSLEVFPNATNLAIRFGTDQGKTSFDTHQIGINKPIMITLIFDENKFTFYLNDGLFATNSYNNIIGRSPGSKLFMGVPWMPADGTQLKYFTVWNGVLKTCDVENLYEKYSMNQDL
jgi:hypothetical protein